MEEEVAVRLVCNKMVICHKSDNQQECRCVGRTLRMGRLVRLARFAGNASWKIHSPLISVREGKRGEEEERRRRRRRGSPNKENSQTEEGLRCVGLCCVVVVSVTLKKQSGVQQISPLQNKNNSQKKKLSQTSQSSKTVKQNSQAKQSLAESGHNDSKKA